MSPTSGSLRSEAVSSWTWLRTTSGREPRRVLDNGYEIAPCQAAQGEDPAKNKAEADQQARMELELNS